jgi:hypothetical protein
MSKKEGFKTFYRRLRGWTQMFSSSPRWGEGWGEVLRFGQSTINF